MTIPLCQYIITIPCGFCFFKRNINLINIIIIIAYKM